MAKNYNQFSCICRLTKDIELKEVGSDHKVGKFSIAVNGRKDDDVLFLDCQVWNKQAEILAQYTKKGSKIFLTGELNQEKWEKDNVKHQRIICNVSNFEFLDSKLKEDGAKKVAESFDNPFSDESVPF